MDVGGGARVVLDGWWSDGESRPVAMEVYVSLGPPKAAQKQKLKSDLLKLQLVRRVRTEVRVRTVVVVTASGARDFLSVGWVARVIELFDIEVVIVALTAEEEAGLSSARRRQAKGMAPAASGERAGSGDASGGPIR